MNKFEWVAANVTEEDIVLDIGCGEGDISRPLRCKQLILLDAWEKAKPDFLLDLENNDLPFEENSIDIILMLDFIEHLGKERGVEILKQAKKIIRKKILLLTPLWWSDNSEHVVSDGWYKNNTHNYHKSLWTLNDFSDWERVLDIYGHENYFLGIWNKP